MIESKGEAHALLALMNFNASRFIARISEEGQIITMENQDRSKWDKNLINTGIHHLNKSIEFNAVSNYLILAAISANHCSSPTFKETNWKQILSLYDQMLMIDNSPIIQLNRAVAISMVEGEGKAIELLEFLKGEKDLIKYHRLYSTLGDLYFQIGKSTEAVNEYNNALELTNIESEKTWILSKIKKCK